MDLSGAWELWIQPEDADRFLWGSSWKENTGIPVRRLDRKPDGMVELPGILQDQGYGEVISRDTEWVSGLHDPFWYQREEYLYGQEEGVSVPFLAQPPRHFLGKAWYEREITIAEDSEKETFLFIELTHWRSSVWLNGEYMGSDCSLCTSHEISLGRIKMGRHRLTVCIDNRFQYSYRPDGHGVSDALGASWNGMAGEILLMTEEERDRRQEEKKAYAASHLRSVQVEDGRFLVDGHPEYFRGTHFGGDYPLTGYPYTDRIWWDKLMLTVKEWGFNFIRCHSLCPPEAAFAAADEAGVYIQPECGMWNVFEEGIPMLGVLKEETERILRQFGHHTSFILFSPTNEPSGNWYGPLRRWVKETRSFDESLGYGGRRLYTAQSGWFYDVPPESIEGTDYIYFHRSAYGPLLGGNIRNHEGWNGKDYRPSLEGARLPVICHEMGQWCSYPDFSVIKKFTGYLRPGNYKVFKESAERHGLLKRNRDFAFCSGKNQLMMYKEELEANFRTPYLYGFEMLDLHDYLGQGTALVGVLDPFWENKGYALPEEFRKFNSQTVLLARISSYCCKNTETLSIPVEICHFGKKALEHQDVVWTLTAEGTGQASNILCRGTFRDISVPVAKNIQAGILELDFSVIHKNTKTILTLSMGTVENCWTIHVFAEQAADKKEAVFYTREWKEAKEALLTGKRVVYAPYLTDLDFDCPSLSIRPVFWNSQMGPGWTRSLGLVMDPGHPAFGHFPTDEYGGWQWEDILSKARGFLLDEMPDGFLPVVTVIDDWNRNLPLGLVLEGRVGEGQLLLVSACLEGSFHERPAAWSFKESLLSYAASEDFHPEAELSLEMVENHLFPNNRMKELKAEYEPEPEAAVNHLEALGQENPNTSVWIEKEHYPISVDIRIKEAVSVSGLILVPDQKDRMHEGSVKDYVIQALVCGSWKEVCRGRFASSFLSQQALFEHRVETDTLRFTALNGYGTGEKTKWQEKMDGWYCIRTQGKSAIQAAGLHIICNYPVKGSDEIYWNQNRKCRTKEIEN